MVRSSTWSLHCECYRDLHFGGRSRRAETPPLVSSFGTPIQVGIAGALKSIDRRHGAVCLNGQLKKARSSNVIQPVRSRIAWLLCMSRIDYTPVFRFNSYCGARHLRSCDHSKCERKNGKRNQAWHRSNEKEVSHGRSRGKHTELISQWGRWLHRAVRSFAWLLKKHRCTKSAFVL
jgi:hypothetical protein